MSAPVSPAEPCGTFECMCCEAWRRNQATALDEIAALRAERDRLDKALADCHDVLKSQRARLTQMEAANARLVELLRMAVAGDLCRGPACQHPDCVAVRAALAPEGT